jgi:probable rRNA maturation factor
MLDLELQWGIEMQSVPTEAQCLQWAQAALQPDLTQQDVALTIRVVDEQESQQLNADYRGKNYPTNVLSFEFEMPPGLPMEEDEPLYLGDMAICAEVVAREAAEQNKSLEAHWAHMVVHGVLHLQGFDHINEDDAVEMETLESDIMQKLGFDNPY